MNRADQVYAIGRGIASLEADDEINQKFLFYVLTDRLNRLLETTTGSVFPNLCRQDIAGLVVPWPDRDERRRIVSVLSAIDDKIELNRRLVECADALWIASVGSVLQSIEENGGSFKGGGYEPLSSVAKFINGRAFTKNASGTGRMVVRIAELNSGPGASTVYNDIAVPNDYLAEPGTLLFAWSGSLTVQRWFRPEAIINQHIFKVVPEGDVPIWLIHAHLLRLLPGYQRIAAGKATTMGHIQRRDLDVAVALPDVPTMTRLDAICSPLWQRALQAEIENLFLVVLSDALLPRLLSGELRVRAAEKLVGEAV